MKKRLAILSTMSGSPWGGSEELWRAAASRLCAEGWAIHVSVQDWGSANAPVLKELTTAGVDVYARRPEPSLMRRLRCTRLGRWLPPANASAYESVWAFKPDLILVNQALGLDFLAPGIASRLERGGPRYALLSQAYPEIPRVLAPADRDRAVRIMRGAAARFFVARRNAEVCRGELLADFGRTEIVANPVAMRGSHEEPWPEPAEHARLACVARLDISTKGQDALLQALAATSQSLPPWRLTLAGSGPHEEYLKSLARDLGLADRIRFAGHVRDIRGFWRDHEALVLPSRLEGTPLALVEAMLCARPALVTDVGDCAEWIDAPRCGECAGSSTPSALAASISRFVADRAEWPRLGKQAAARAAAQLSADPATTFSERLKALVE